MLIDTHAHLDYPEFNADFDAMLQRAEDAGVSRVLTIGTSLESSREAIRLAERHTAIHAVVGIHPTAPPETSEDIPGELRKLAAHPKVVAIGETGLDYHRLPGSRFRDRESLGIPGLNNETPDDIEGAIEDGAYKSAQAELFQIQLDLAAELGLNVVIHQRDAWVDTLEMLRPYTGRLRGVFHCFGGDLAQAEALFSMNHLVSFTGIVTFKNAAIVRETAAAAPADRFMVETDCPYLAPVPHRGKRCEPAHTRLVAEKIAELRGVPLETLAEETTRTAEAFFRLSS
jgi:TatD DNase family protein